MQYTAEQVKEYLKNYHIYKGKVVCETASEQTAQAIMRLDVAIYNLGYKDEGLIKGYYIKKDGSLSAIAKDCRCSKNNIAKKLNRIIEKIATMMSDDEHASLFHNATNAPFRITEIEVKRYLKRLKEDNGKTRNRSRVIDENYLTVKNILIRAIHSLNDKDQQFILELYLYGETLSAIGNTYGYSVSGVKYRINLAVKKICAIINHNAEKIHN